eukprot:351689-Chlamydomonas_euryale.AAC.7
MSRPSGVWPSTSSVTSGDTCGMAPQKGHSCVPCVRLRAWRWVRLGGRGMGEAGEGAVGEAGAGAVGETGGRVWAVVRLGAGAG